MSHPQKSKFSRNTPYFEESEKHKENYTAIKSMIKNRHQLKSIQHLSKVFSLDKSFEIYSDSQRVKMSSLHGKSFLKDVYISSPKVKIIKN